MHILIENTNNPNKVPFFKKLAQGEYTTGTWEEKSREINFADFKFSITHHYLKQECAESEGKEDSVEGTFIGTLIAVMVAKIFPMVYNVNAVCQEKVQRLFLYLPK